MSESVGEGHTIKCMIVGDSSTGKTHLFRKFTNQSLPVEYTPTVFDICNLEVESEDGCKLNLNLWDSAGSQVYDNIRPISYAHTDCFIICYSINNKESFENVWSRWLPEINKHGDGPTVPILLVATKYDLIEQNDEKANNDQEQKDDFDYVTEPQGEAMKEKIGAKSFFSCSTFKEMNVRGMLQTTIDHAYQKKLDDDKPSDPIWKFCSSTVVFMGDKGVGKTSIIQACIKNNSLKVQQGKSQSDKIQEYYHDFVSDGCEYFLRIVEIPCEVKYLKSAIQQVDVIVLCYAVDDPFSFQSTELLLGSEFKGEFKSVPIILVGTKSDLKTESVCVIPAVDGELLKQKTKCVSFIECSATTLENVSYVLGAMLDSIKEDTNN